jgi:2-ketocyclohexanecarboxyl-CoA hydrolase
VADEQEFSRRAFMSASTKEQILVEKIDGVAWITFNREDRFNAFDYETFGALRNAIEAAGYDPTIGVIVITGAGDKSFCAGGYLADLQDFSILQARKLYNISQELYQMMRKVPQPIIAAVNGYAIGGGNELVICSDLAIASEHAKFGQTGPKIGSSPMYGGNNLLAMTIGEKRAREVCMLCRQYTAQEAYEMGWINKVVPHHELRAEVSRWAQEILDKLPSYIEITKICSNVWWDSLTPTMEHAKQAMLRLAGGPEMTEGATAFMEKRKPNTRQFRR